METNPYLEARREWDERYADLVLGKRNWQMAAGGLTNREIGEKLTHFKGHPKGDRAREHVWTEMKKIKLAFDDSMPMPT